MTARGVHLTALFLCGVLAAATAHGQAADAELLQAECQYGITLALAGEIERAEEVFTSLLSNAPGDPRALNNLGNLYVLRDELEVALAFYGRAREGDEEDAGILLNLASVHVLLGDDESAQQCAAEARRLAGGVGKAASLLGLTVPGEEGADRAAEKTRMKREEMLNLLESAIEEIPAESTAVADSTVVEATEDGKKKKGVWRAAGPRAARDADDLPILYWKR